MVLDSGLQVAGRSPSAKSIHWQSTTTREGYHTIQLSSVIAIQDCNGPHEYLCIKQVEHPPRLSSSTDMPRHCLLLSPMPQKLKQTDRYKY